MNWPLTLENVGVTSAGRRMLSSNRVVNGSKKLRFIKEQEASRLLLGPNSSFRGIPLIRSIL